MRRMSVASVVSGVKRVDVMPSGPNTRAAVKASSVVPVMRSTIIPMSTKSQSLYTTFVPGGFASGRALICAR